MPVPSTDWRRLRPFFIWLVLFYTGWASIVFFGSWWSTLADHWPIAVSMAFGSYVAGSTPMGGGTIGFPVLVLIFDQPATLGRDFAFAVQSIGMVSASIYILAARRPIDWHLLRPALLGALIGTPLGAAFIAPHVSDVAVKLIFAVTWASFGVMHFVKVKEIVAATGLALSWPGKDRPIGLAIGISGGVVASMMGVGIDMMIYAVLVLIYRADLKIAIPTSVILMAFTSLTGIATNALLAAALPESYAISPEVLHNWLAAAPVVALGAPFGAWALSRLPRTPTLLIVSALCIVQFVATILKVGLHGWSLAWAVAAVLAVNLVFSLMFSYGEKLRRQ